MARLFRHCKQQKPCLSVLIFMSIKFTIQSESANSGRFAVAAPSASDVIRGALQQAFATPSDERDLTTLLARIDRAERGRA
jgi:hypothetical protein